MTSFATPLFATSLLLIGALFGCAPTSNQLRESPEDPVEPTVADAPSPTAVWLQRHAQPVAVEADHFDDLAFLRPLLEGKRIVQLGENTHGVREYNLVKARLVRFLHQELGYDVLAFESDLYQCYDSDLTAADAPALATLTRCAFGVWHTKEVLPLFEYLKESQGDDRPLHLAGIDVQPIGNNKADRPQFLSNIVGMIDPIYAAEVAVLDSTFLDVYALDRRERSVYFRGEKGRRMLKAYDRVAKLLADNADVTPTHLVAVARRTAASTAWYIRQQTAPSTRDWFERRDEGMAENLTFLLDELYPDRKVIVWGHNFHLRHDNAAIPPDSTMYPDVPTRTMGSWIHERYGDELYTIGLYAYQGRAADNHGDVYEIEPAGRGSVEGLLHRNDGNARFVDLSRAPREPGTAWMDAFVTARYNGTTPLPMVLRNQYDAILVFDEVTPRIMLN